MKKWLIGLLILSLCLNIYQFGKGVWQSLYTPTNEDRMLLGEMTQRVVESEEYQQLAETEKIYAITTGVDRIRVGGIRFIMM